jgi:metal-dependent amidase/aminoacylase/carboxypeptidase family protein
MFESMGFDTEKMIAIRKDIHKHAEGAFKEFRTSKLIKDILIGYGLKEENIKACAGTGLVVDIYGTGEDI